jgi:hypothetical protein
MAGSSQGITIPPSAVRCALPFHRMQSGRPSCGTNPNLPATNGFQYSGTRSTNRSFPLTMRALQRIPFAWGHIAWTADTGVEHNREVTHGVPVIFLRRALKPLPRQRESALDSVSGGVSTPGACIRGGGEYRSVRFVEEREPLAHYSRLIMKVDICSRNVLRGCSASGGIAASVKALSMSCIQRSRAA